MEEWIKLNNKIEKISNNWTKIKFKLLFFDIRNFFRKDSKFNKFSTNEISKKLLKLKKILKIKEDFEIIKISKKSFIIRKKK